MVMYSSLFLEILSTRISFAEDVPDGAETNRQTTNCSLLFFLADLDHGERDSKGNDDGKHNLYGNPQSIKEGCSSTSK